MPSLPGHTIRVVNDDHEEYDLNIPAIQLSAGAPGNHRYMGHILFPMTSNTDSSNVAAPLHVGFGITTCGTETIATADPSYELEPA